MEAIFKYLLNLDIWNIIFAGISCITGILTLVIAVKLYDRYGIKGKIKSNRIDLTFEILDFLRKRTIEIRGTDNIDIKKKGKRMRGYLEFGEGKSVKIYGMENFPLYFDYETYKTFSIKLEELLNSLWTPKEIKESMQFLVHCGTDIVEYSQMNKENIMIKFSYSNINNGKVIPVTKYKTYEEYRLEYEKSMKRINKWLKENNIDIKF